MTGRRVARIVMVVFGVLAVLFALSLLAGGAALVWAKSDETDSEGFFTTHPHRFESSSYAITSEKLDVGTGVPGWVFGSGRYAKIGSTPRARAGSRSSSASAGARTSTDISPGRTTTRSPTSRRIRFRSSTRITPARRR